MAGSIVIACPECHKRSQAPPAIQGKKVRCKACGHVFAAWAAVGRADEDEDLKRVEVKSFAQQMIEEDFKDDSNPYGVTTVDLRPRCPHCAAEMDEGDVICLNCGYNTRTRMHGTTLRVYAPTPFEWIKWLLPGVACVLAVGALVALICFLWIGMPGMAQKHPDSWLWWFFDNFPTQVYGTVVSLGLIWLAGRFAVLRLIMNPHPPEKLKR